jgi:hypothetical protein
LQDDVRAPVETDRVWLKPLFFRTLLGAYFRNGNTSVPNRSSERIARAGSSPGNCVLMIRSVSLSSSTIRG